MLAIRSVNFWPQIIKKNFGDDDFIIITNGEFEVVDILAWDETKNEV